MPRSQASLAKHGGARVYIPDTNQVSACQRKIQYGSKSEAKHAAADVTRRFGNKMHPYQCANCHRWHITHISPEVFRARKQRDRVIERVEPLDADAAFGEWLANLWLAS